MGERTSELVQLPKCGQMEGTARPATGALELERSALTPII